jgi:3-hydroxyisobutyrate dehydrogenase-like beta-hydroxyacid dehydrogenase
VDVLDAPVSGSTPQAEDGTLVMFVGGELAAYERVRPILTVLAGDVFYLGDSGAGATMKLVVNGLLGTGMQALAESLVLGERAGLQKETLLSVLEQTSVLAPGVKRKLQNARSDSYPVQFPLRLMWKDLNNAMQLAQERSVPVPLTAAAEQVFAIEQSHQVEEDVSAVIRTMEELAGSIRSDSDGPRDRKSA